MPSDPFFKSTKEGRGNKRAGEKRKRIVNNKHTKESNDNELKLQDEELEEGSSQEGSQVETDEELEEIIETAEEKRLRLAKEYLKNISEGIEEDALEVDAKDIDRDIIAERLQRDNLEAENRIYYQLVNQMPNADEFIIKNKKAHQLAVTSIQVDHNKGYIITGSKDASIIIWNIESLQKIHTFPGGRKGVKKFDGHTEPILCLALSYDGRYLASGGKDKRINIWDMTTLSFKGSLIQHKDAVSGVTFRNNSYDLYTCSFDRTIKVWNVEEMAYIETLFGHQDTIIDIKSLNKEQCITVGARDKTLRLWKIIEQTQLVFRGGITTKLNDENDTKFVEGSLDKLCMLDESNFITGGDSGSICCWNTQKKKPSFTFPTAHGIDPINHQPFGITALASVPFTDLVVSGSNDGYLRLWKATFGAKRNLEPITSIPIVGYINNISISSPQSKFHQIKKVNGKYEDIKFHIIVAKGQEQTHGRWDPIKNAKNGFTIIDMVLKSVPKSL